MAGKTDPYFDDYDRPILYWASAVRRQLGRWDPLIAKHTLMKLESNLKPPPTVRTTMAPEDYWQGEVEHHFLLIAAGNLLKAIDLLPNPPSIEQVVRDELKEARDLNEHWVENIPVFNQTPRPRDPGYPSGKRFAARNPRAGPYNWWMWNGDTGPMVTPNVSGLQVRTLADEAIAAVGGTESPFIVEAPAMHWIKPESEGQWWWPAPPQSAGD
jgi:hypothetical protein